jgi:hypothetical protein
MAIYADCKSKREARLRWRKSPKGRAWDHAYYQRPEVKARRHEQYIKRLIKEANENNNIRTTGNR